ncbi:MAG TPA: ParA family protein [Sumerlaeia bacterium]|nr:ParA family protein [Sumerlaeia bacterium]
MFLNFKGGTGKTTLSAAYGLQLVKMGRRVLFVDLDPQGHLTKCLGINEWQFDATLFHVLTQDVPVGDVLKKAPGLEAFVVPADISLSAVDLSLGPLPYREWRLVHALSSLTDEFEVVVLDASPTINLLNLNAVLASRDLIVPVLPDSLSLFGLRTLMKTLASIEADFSHRIENIGILLNRFLPDDANCEDVRKRLKQTYSGRVLETVIRHCSELSREPALNRFGARLSLCEEALADFRALIQEIAPLPGTADGEKGSRKP